MENLEIKEKLCLESRLVAKTLLNLDRQLAPKLNLRLIQPDRSLLVVSHRYFVEYCFISAYLTGGGVDIMRLSDLAPYETKDPSSMIQSGFYTTITPEISASGPTCQSLELIYFGTNSENDAIGRDYGLGIIDESDNLVYFRNPDQDPLLDWQVNYLANYLIDNHGRYIFPGSPNNL